MSIKEQKRQQKLARQKRKRKEKKSTVSGKGLSLVNRVMNAARYPLEDCLVPAETFETGMGTVIVSRKMPNGMIAVSAFLLDVFCLGAKNAYFKLLEADEYQQMLDMIGRNENLQPMSPSCTRKLIEECVAYANDIGFKPHPDYAVTWRILGDIDAMECDETFEFGKDGKPFYIQGPNESPQRIRQIMNTLEESRGPGGSHFMLQSDSLD